MVALPTLSGDTMPVALTVATAVLLLLQVPPLTVSVRDAGVPAQKVDGPPMVPAVATVLTVTGCVAMAVPQLPLTV